MNTVLALVQQIIIMLLLAGVGFLLFKGGKITQEGSKAIGNMLIYVSLPSVIIRGFLVERTAENVRGLLVSAVLAALSLAVCFVLSRIFFRKDSMAAFASSFANPGFFGIPLIMGLLGDGAVFYVAAFIGFINITQFTYGKVLMTGDRKSMSAKQVLTAPFVFALAIGLILFFTQLQLPAIILKGMEFTAGINTPLAMFSVGIYLAQTDLASMFRKKILYLISLSRMIIIPLIFVLMLKFVPNTWYDIKLAVLIASACPVGSNIAVYAQLYDEDYRYAVETVVVSTLLSIICVPFVVYIAEHFW